MAIRGTRPRFLVSGEADARFDAVAQAFETGFERGEEVGAAIAVYENGVRVVNLWGGIADTRSQAPWASTTASVIFSCTKGLVAICAYLLVQDGLLDLDAPVAAYWPEFAANGKDGITVRMVLSHRAGLLALDDDFTLDDVIAWEPVVRAMERQRPVWEPGTDHSYHPMTYGWLVGEVIARISGLRPGAFLRERVSDVLPARAWIGTQRDADVAWMLPPPPDPDTPLARAIAVVADQPIVRRAATMSGAYAFPTDQNVVTFNDPRIRTAEIPGANGMATADGLARIYGACVAEVDGHRLVNADSVQDALIERSSGRQRFGGPDLGHRWGTGFVLDSPPFRPLIGPRSFGHDGAGGQLAFADADRRLGFGYIHNQMGALDDQRANRLVAAVRASLAI